MLRQYWDSRPAYSLFGARYGAPASSINPVSSMRCVQVTVRAAWGSTPREAGASMLVSESRVEGTIGGGQLEFRAIATARDLLARWRARPREPAPRMADAPPCACCEPFPAKCHGSTSARTCSPRGGIFRSAMAAKVRRASSASQLTRSRTSSLDALRSQCAPSCRSWQGGATCKSARRRLGLEIARSSAGPRVGVRSRTVGQARQRCANSTR